MRHLILILMLSLTGCNSLTHQAGSTDAQSTSLDIQEIHAEIQEDTTALTEDTTSTASAIIAVSSDTIGALEASAQRDTAMLLMQKSQEILGNPDVDAETEFRKLANQLLSAWSDDDAWGVAIDKIELIVDKKAQEIEAKKDAIITLENKAKNLQAQLQSQLQGAQFEAENDQKRKNLTHKSLLFAAGICGLIVLATLYLRQITLAMYAAAGAGVCLTLSTMVDHWIVEYAGIGIIGIFAAAIISHMVGHAIGLRKPVPEKVRKKIGQKYADFSKQEIPD